MESLLINGIKKWLSKNLSYLIITNGFAMEKLLNVDISPLIALIFVGGVLLIEIVRWLFIYILRKDPKEVDGDKKTFR